MRAHLNNFKSLVAASANRREWLDIGNRRLQSDAVTATATATTEQARPPLVDLHGRIHNYLRISLTEKCNLRCQYCMPADGVPLSARSEILSRAELSRLARTFAALGVQKVRLTGGEPTIRRDLADIIEELTAIPGITSVAMTTNGLTLTRRLVAYQRAGLSALNVSLDSLRQDRYEKMARRPGLQRVLAGLDLALQLGYRNLKINTVLMKGFNDDEICDFVEFTKDREVEVRFIEFMPFTGNEWSTDGLVPHKVAVRALMERYPDARPRLPRPNDTARVWQVPGHLGSVGFISSMTNHFCGTCNRLRLTADGNLKVCLFGNSEVSLRDAVRGGASESELESMIRTALNNKKPQHAARGPADSRAGPTAAELPTPKTTRKTKFAIPPPRFAVPLIPMLQIPTKQYQIRGYSTNSTEEESLTHLDSKGQARMVDVGDKDVTARVAVAECNLQVGARLIRLLRDVRLPKGDALTVAQIAGVIGAKKTSDLIPLAHPLSLDCVRVKVELPKGECNDGGDIKIHCEVRVQGRTGVEMEAMTGAAIASLALYDMCKSVDKGMKVTNLRVVKKTGGRSGDWPRQPPANIKVKPYETSKIKHAPPSQI